VAAGFVSCRDAGLGRYRRGDADADEGGTEPATMLAAA
jgi:hypothetical protein